MESLAVFMPCDIAPTKCKCCDCKLDFTEDKQNRNYELKGMYRVFKNKSHIKRYKKLGMEKL